MTNIIVTRTWPETAQQSLKALGQTQLNSDNRPFTQKQLKDAFKTADIVCATVTDAITKSVIGSSPRTKLIANFGVGFNHIDLAAARAAGIVVTNTPGVLTAATAEIAMTLLLMAARRTAEGDRLVRAGLWEGWHPTHMLSTQVSNKTLGIVGMGRIGLAVARQARHGFGMKILYSGNSRKDQACEAELNARNVDMDTLLQQSDFISLHCPATPDTRHLIDQQALDAMQPHAFLINTARGEIVDQNALIQALKEKRIAGAGLDVYENEPNISPSLLNLENVVLLPHMGSNTIETRDAMGRCAVENVTAFIEGEELPNPVLAP